jgi:flagellar basal-body rod protein FlgB
MGSVVIGVSRRKPCASSLAPDARDRSTGKCFRKPANRVAATGNPLPVQPPYLGKFRQIQPRRKIGTPLADLSRRISREVTAMADNTLFGIHGAALEVRGQRMGVLASNIANASTPGFKARDIDFQQALSSATGSGGLTDTGLASATKYRVPLQPSLDGNTVDLSTEQTAFAENAVQYQTTLSFLNGRIGQITRALRGE